MFPSLSPSLSLSLSLFSLHRSLALVLVTQSRAAGTPAVKINTLDAGLSPQKLDLRQFDARLGRSDLRATGQIDNLLAYFSTTKTMTGAMTFNSGYFDANEWMTPCASTPGRS